MNNLLKKRGVTSIVVTLVIVALLILSGPVTAVQVRVKKDKTYYNANDVVKFTASVDIETNERVPINNLTIKIYNSNSQVIRECAFSPSGALLSSCTNILNITVLNAVGYANDTGLFGYGYGYGPSGWDSSNQTFFETTYGYGYGYATGYSSYSGELAFNITWNISAESINDGQYTADLWAYAEDGLGNYRYYTDSTPTTGDNAFTYDKTKPSSSSSSDLYDNSGNISVSFSSSDGTGSGIQSVALWYNFNNGTWIDSNMTKTSGSFNFQPRDGDGLYGFYTIATDIAGNVEDAPSSADSTTTYDTTSPSSAATSTLYTNNGNITVNYTSNGAVSGIRNVSLWYKKDAGSWTFTNLSTNENGSFAFDVSGEGNYSFYTVATDNAGNLENKTTADNITIYDATRPSSSATSQALDLAANITINFTASDSLSGISQVALYYSTNDGSSWTAWSNTATGTSGQFNFQPDTTANHTFYTIATDNAGNIEQSTGADTYTYYDSAAPVVTVTAPTETVTSSSTTLRITTDENASCRHSTTAGLAFVNMSNATETTWGASHSWSLSGLQNGVKHYYIRCKDIYNHTSTDHDASFTVDIPSTTGGGGGGGGGRYEPLPSNILDSVAQQWGVIASNREIQMQILADDVSFTEIRFELGQESTGSSVFVKSFKEKPESIEDVGTTVFQYLEINDYNIEDVLSVELDFRVPKEWLRENNVAWDDVVLYRYVNGNWVELPTQRSHQDTEYVYYTATSPGFSYYAVGTRKEKPSEVVLLPEPEEEKPPEEVVTPPVVIPPGQPPAEEEVFTDIVILIIIILAVIILIIILWFKVPEPHHFREARVYVRRARQLGKSDSEIAASLERHGWPRREIDRVMRK